MFASDKHVHNDIEDEAVAFLKMMDFLFSHQIIFFSSLKTDFD